jgi:hypothetical protein
LDRAFLEYGDWTVIQGAGTGQWPTVPDTEGSWTTRLTVHP